MNKYSLSRSATDRDQQSHTEYMQVREVGNFPEILREKYVAGNIWRFVMKADCHGDKDEANIPF